MRQRALLRGLLPLALASGCGSSPSLHDYEPPCGGVEPPPPCDIEPADACIGSALPRITERDFPPEKIEALRTSMASGTVSIRRSADGSSAELVPGCRLDGGYREVLGERGSGRLWVAERVVFAPSEVGASCETATHTVVALVLAPEPSDAPDAPATTPNASPRTVALLAPLPCPNVDERTPAQGCIGAGLNGRARVLEASERYAKYSESWKEELHAERPLAKTFAVALEIYALAPDHRESDGDFPDSIEVLRRPDLGRTGAYAYANANYVIEDVNQTGHAHPPPRFEAEAPPLFLDCFPGLFDPAVGSYGDSPGGYCWKPASAGPAPERTDPSPPASVSAGQSRPTETKPDAPPSVKPLAGPAQAPSSGPAPEAALASAKKLYQSGDLPAAQAALETLRASHPRDAKVAVILGATLRALGDRRGATREYAAALELDPTLTKVSIALATLLFDAGDAAGTLRVADAALRTSPKVPELSAYRALSLDALSRKNEALAAYPLALELRPDDPALHVGYGALLSDAHRSREALRELRAALSAKDPALLERAAEIFTTEGAFDDCIRAALSALEYQGDRVRLLVRSAICKDGIHDEAGAAKDYDTALTLRPNYPPLNYHYGLHLVAKNQAKALEHLDRAASIAGERGVGPEARKKAAELRKTP